MHTREEKLAQENQELRARLEEADETLRAIRHGEVDALLVSGPAGEQVFTLESAEQPYRILIEQMQEGAVTLSEDGVILYCNLRFAEMLDVPHEKVLASSVHSYILPNQAQHFASLLRKGMTERARAEISLCTADQSFFPTYMTVGPLPVEVEGCLCMVVTDLTEQESLRRSHAEIELLNEQLKRSMTETHHRIKNSLQIIGSMVDMQVMEETPTVSMEEMKRLGTQIKSLAIVHDLLTMEAKKDGLAHVVSGREVLKGLLSLLDLMAHGRLFEMRLEDILLTSAQAASLALITNEVVSNALKHGQGTVEVTFEAQDRNAVLEICDDGPGFPPRFDARKLTTTGIGLIEDLTRWDLKGRVNYENRPEGGATVRITLPLPTE